MLLSNYFSNVRNLNKNVIAIINYFRGKNTMNTLNYDYCLKRIIIKADYLTTIKFFELLKKVTNLVTMPIEQKRNRYTKTAFAMALTT